jgi:Plasma-membrane choline transporter
MSGNMSTTRSDPASKQAYTMVPATAVLDDDDDHRDFYGPTGTSTAKKNNVGHDASVPSTAHVLGVVEGSSVLPSSSSHSMDVAGGNSGDDNDDDGGYAKGVVLEPSYNDVWFAAAFAVNVVATMALAVFAGIPFLSADAAASASNNSNGTSTTKTKEDGGDDDDDHVFRWLGILLLLGAAWSFLALKFVVRGSLQNAARVVQVAYFAAPILLVASSAVLFALGDSLGAALAPAGVLWAFVLLVGWRPLRKFVPFAAATLHVSAIAVRENLGVVAVSIGSVLLVLAWMAIWILAFAGVSSLFHKDDAAASSSSSSNKDDAGDGSALSLRQFVAYAVLLSLYWGHQVIKNVVHFATSGAISTWWFMPSHEHDGASAVRDSLRRATTHSFGSVCMASLLNTIAETLEATLRSNDHQSLLSCVLVCLLSCLRVWLEMFNSFALVYAALYNSSYLAAGRQVVRLFKHAGWTTFINDCLVFRVLCMCQFAAATLTGLSSMALYAAVSGGGGGSAAASATSTTANDDDGDGASYSTTLALMYVFGFVMGLLASNPVLFVLESAARTIMVCLAEQPYQFANAHPELFETLTKGWSEAYPEAWQQQKAVSTTAVASEVVPSSSASRTPIV